MRKIDVARRVDEIQLIVCSVRSPVIEGDRIALDGDAAFAFDVHRIEHLVMQITLRNGTTSLDKSVRQGRFAMVDMSDNAKISYVLHVVVLASGFCSGNSVKQQERFNTRGTVTGGGTFIAGSLWRTKRVRKENVRSDNQAQASPNGFCSLIDRFILGHDHSLNTDRRRLALMPRADANPWNLVILYCPWYRPAVEAWRWATSAPEPSGSAHAP